MINLQIRESGVFVELEDKGIKRFRQVEPQALIEVLTMAIYDNVKNEVIASPLLPPGTIKFEQEMVHKESYVLYLHKKARLAPIIFESRGYTIGYPATIYRFQIKNKVVIKTSLWAVIDTVLNPETLIYHYPFFNVFSNGNMCMGSNRITIEEPWQLHKMPDVFTNMPFTYAMETQNLSGLQGDSFLIALENKPFPNEWLKPTKQSLKTLLNSPL